MTQENRKPRKYLAFDIETAKETPGDFSLWRNHRPLGICCAATCTHEGELRQWYSHNADDSPAPRMKPGDLRILVDHLCDAVLLGYTILTWNGASFDFDVLAEESARLEHCRKLAHDHVDMMFHIVCLRGRGVKLQKAAEGLGLPGKLTGVVASDVPRLWANGEHAKVLAYAEQDVRLALQVADVSERRGEFAWISQTEERKTLPLPHGWLSVREAMKLPLPDLSGLAKPMAREDFLAWMMAGH